MKLKYKILTGGVLLAIGAYLNKPKIDKNESGFFYIETSNCKKKIEYYVFSNRVQIRIVVFDCNSKLEKEFILNKKNYFKNIDIGKSCFFKLVKNHNTQKEGFNKMALYVNDKKIYQFKHN